MRLLLRTTRKLTLTFEGQAFPGGLPEAAQRPGQCRGGGVAGGVQASGYLKVSAPAGFLAPACGAAGRRFPCRPTRRCGSIST